MNEGKWITLRDGRHILLKPKEIKMKDTNFYMNQKIRNNTQTSKATDEKAYQLTDEQLQQVIDESISKWDEDYAQLYMTKMNPQKFLDLTLTPSAQRIVEAGKFDLDVSKMNEAKYVADMMYLDIDLQTGKIEGHEGRHRALALTNAGYKEMDVVVWARNYDKYHTKEYTNFEVKQQYDESIINRYENDEDKKVVLKKLVPVSKRNIDRIKERDY